jgi:fructose-1,6-bisphosphatase/inositol monophosphatase family enzyme
VSGDLDLAARAVRAGAAAALAERDRARDTAAGGPGPGRGNAALDVEVKDSPTDFVSRADTASEAAIVALLRAERPDDGVLGEEGAAAESANGRRWVVDGIDGTFNFLSGIPHWCVAVGLEQDGDPVAGAVFDPTGDELFLAGPGAPATANGAAARVRTGRALEAAAVATYLRPDKSEHRDATLSRLVDEIGIVRAGGAGTLELAWVAAGRVDAWAQPNVSPWDWVPGAALIRAAGGEAVILDGEPAWHVAGPAELVEALARIVPRR